MNKNLVIKFALIFLILSLFFTQSSLTELIIKSKINKANYCDIASDCVDVGGKCPFGCYIYVNKGEFNKISELVNSYKSKCVYGCISCQEVDCINNKCKEICE
ncbi:MAG: hypothetical protein WC260_01930 [Candidatus Pacearchaeota archaeon]